MDIILENHEDGKRYTTFDPVTGKVEITAPQDARFDEIRITLEGSIRTFVENLSPHSTKARTTATHNFLKLSMPIRDSEYPQPRIAEAGRTYTFPFNFNIPDQLLPRSCSHRCLSDNVYEAHLRLPPSMGSRELSGQDDLAPEMGKVTYSIKVKVVRNRERDGEERVLVEGSKKIHIVPASPEEPPMSVSSADKDYILCKSKSLKKGMFSGKLGKITVTAAQPSALVLPSPASPCVPVTTIATVNLRFDPHEISSQPPRLGGLTTKIKASTYYAARPAVMFPSHLNMVQQFESTRGVYDTTTPLSSRCVEAVAWTKHTPSPAYMRRNSASSTSSDSDSSLPPSSSQKDKPYYTAEIVVPITLPSTKTWIPTFHSCILSRTYTIEQTLTIHTPGTGVPASSVNLRLPVQIAAKGDLTRRATLTPEEAAAELVAADEFLRPRVLEMPSPELVGNSVLRNGSVSEEERGEGMGLPPSYEDFGARLTRPVISRG